MRDNHCLYKNLPSPPTIFDIAEALYSLSRVKNGARLTDALRERIYANGHITRLKVNKFARRLQRNANEQVYIVCVCVCVYAREKSRVLRRKMKACFRGGVRI